MMKFNVGLWLGWMRANQWWLWRVLYVPYCLTLANVGGPILFLLALVHMALVEWFCLRSRDD